MSTLTVVGSPPPVRLDSATVAERVKEVREKGIEYWARRTMTGRLGNITEDVKKIWCPMLVITTEGSGLASVAQTRAWQEQVPHSELVVLPGDSFHVAASDPDGCARATLDFITRNPQR